MKTRRAPTLTKEVFKMLKQSYLNFRGNIEGHDLFADPVEVVVCDGFVGNVTLKTCEVDRATRFSNGSNMS